jgi:selenide,water dikinase
MAEKNFFLTQFSHGAGCGCKISQKVLSQILSMNQGSERFPELLVGNSDLDDAAVMNLGDGTAIISTTDFFMPIVDDPFSFGRIAAVNAISDVYAMGGTPLLAIAILGWPVDKIPPELAGEVMAGARGACKDAGIPVGGGHSIDSPEPIFGLAVTGRVPIEHIKRNTTARAGDLLYLTKPLGVGILTTAQKKGLLQDGHVGLAEKSMFLLNSIGSRLGGLSYVHAMTDVTGFGLMGHLSEICEGSDLSATIHFNRVPLLDPSALDFYIEKKSIPGGTYRNYESIKNRIDPLTDHQKAVLCDPQTSGGLLIAVDPEFQGEFEALLSSSELPHSSIGILEERSDLLIKVSS